MQLRQKVIVNAPKTINIPEELAVKKDNVNYLFHLCKTAK